MTEREMLEAEKYWCENCCNWDKGKVQMDAYSTCKLTGTRVFAQESGKECKCFNVTAESVIVPPCKVGDTVYACKGCFYLPHATKIKANESIVCEVIAIKETKKGKSLLLKPLIEEAFNMRSANGWFPFSSIGKTVFHTKEEAEQALRKEDEGK